MQANEWMLAEVQVAGAEVCDLLNPGATGDSSRPGWLTRSISSSRRTWPVPAKPGPVVPPDEIDRLFQPFQRLKPDRLHADGHGLGLAIVRAIADAHAAKVTVTPRPEGGLRIDVDFVGGVS